MGELPSPPTDLIAREQEWADLCRFVEGRRAGMSLAVVYGRRRQGKSYLLRRLCEAYGGRYVMAAQEERIPALRRFVADAAAGAPPPAGAEFAVSDWEAALRIALAPTSDDRPVLLVIDEFPYLVRHSPEIPSLLQRLYDTTGHPVRIVLCGSAISVMSDLLSGTRPLRGRAGIDMCLRPFDHRTAARLWNAPDPETAFAIDAVLGGTPGYRDLVDAATPTDPHEFDAWLGATVLNPSHALFTESDYLLREDPRLAERGVYHSILEAIAGGARTPTAIGARIGRDRTALAHPLGVLRATGFVHNDEDLRWQRRPSLRLADPIVRFTQLIVTPRLASFEDRRWQPAWAAARPTFESAILGPHFEHLAREWVRRFAAADDLGQDFGELGRTVVNDAAGKARYEIDVAALAPGDRRQSPASAFVLLGEAKSSLAPRGVGDLARLERIRALLINRQAAVPDATLLLFGRAGFSADLRTEAARRADLVLVDLDRIYGSRPP